MIKLTKSFDVDTDFAEGIKIFETKMCYGDIAIFWEDTNSSAIISLLDNNMVISGNARDYSELKEFIKVINPSSIFSSCEVLSGLGLLENSLTVDVLKSEIQKTVSQRSDRLSSNEVYDILSKSGLDVGNYEYFAPDFCLRLNRGRLKYFGIKGTCVAVSIGNENVLINGVASLCKGFGTVCLNGLLNEISAKNILVCAKQDISPFYIKNGFVKLYKAGYWRK